MTIKNVIFDFGGVLLDWDLRYLFEKLIDDPAELNWFLENVVTKKWHFQADQGAMLSHMVAERSAIFPQYAHLIQAYADRFEESIPRFIDGTADIIEDLAAQNITLFAITNFGAEFFERYRAQQPIFNNFEDIIVSGAEKIIKPAPEIFTLALRRFGIKPQQAIFIDDVRSNIDAARNSGFATHHFITAKALRHDLVGRGLLVQ